MITLFIVAAIVSIYVLQSHRQAHSVKDRYPSVEALAALHNATPPLLSAEQALGFAIHQLDILGPLDDIESKEPIDSWSLQVDGDAKQPDSVWTVRISSIGLPTPFICARAFDRSGRIVSLSWPHSFCAFEK